MKVQIEDISTVKKALTIEIPQEVVSKAFSSAYANLNYKVKVPGFRPGKVPVSLLAKRYGSAVKDEILRDLIPDHYEKAVNETGIFPVDLPVFAQVEANNNAPLSFKATVEVRPEITLADYDGIILPRKVIEVSEEDLEQALKAKQEELAQLEACADDYAAASSDYVIMNFEGSVKDIPLAEGKQDGFSLQIGSNTLPEPLEAALIGKIKGDAVDLEVPYPEDFQNKDVAGQSVRFKVDILEIKKKVLPAIDDEFAKDAGLADLDALKSELRASLLDQKLAKQKEDQRKVLSEKLIAMHSFEVPDCMIAHELQTMMSYFKGNTQETEGSEGAEKMQKLLEPAAKERVQEGLILSEISKKAKLDVNAEEIETEIEEIAKRRGFSPAEMKRQVHKKEGAISGIRSQLLERKALDLVFSKAGFEDVLEGQDVLESQDIVDTEVKPKSDPDSANQTEEGDKS